MSNLIPMHTVAFPIVVRILEFAVNVTGVQVVPVHRWFDHLLRCDIPEAHVFSEWLRSSTETDLGDKEATASVSSDGKSTSPNLQGPVSISMDLTIFWFRPFCSQPLDFLLIYKLVDLIHKLPQVVWVLRKVSLSVDQFAIAVARYVPESALHVNNIREVVFAICGYYFFQSFTFVWFRSCFQALKKIHDQFLYTLVVKMNLMRNLPSHSGLSGMPLHSRTWQKFVPLCALVQATTRSPR